MLQTETTRLPDTRHMPRANPPPSPPPHALREVATVFLRLGLISFGGPAAHIALMEDELVRRRHWVTHADFLDLLSATNLIPGPNSTELALHLGHRRAGWPGLIVAGLCFILPAALIVAALAWAYVRFGSIPQAAGLLSGIKPVLIPIILQALWSLGRTAMRTTWLVAMAILAALASLSGIHELIILFAACLVMILHHTSSSLLRPRLLCFLPITAGSLGLPTLATTTPFSLPDLFFFFLKVGSVLYGSGYVLLAFLRADLVERWGWLTESQLLDAIAVGQITPGPLFTTATFIGFLLGGAPGATLATLAIFLPAFIFVALSGPLIPKLRASPTASAVLDGLNTASLALMAVVTFHLGTSALADPLSIAIAIVTGYFLFRHRVNSLWLILAGATLGLLR